VYNAFGLFRLYRLDLVFDYIVVYFLSCRVIDHLRYTFRE